MQHDPHHVPRRWKLMILSILLGIGLALLSGLAWYAYHRGDRPDCPPGGKSIEFCDPYLPNIPGKEGR